MNNHLYYCQHCYVELFQNRYWDPECCLNLCLVCYERHTKKCVVNNKHDMESEKKLCDSINCHVKCEKCDECIGNYSTAKKTICRNWYCRYQYLCNDCFSSHDHIDMKGRNCMKMQSCRYAPSI